MPFTVIGLFIYYEQPMNSLRDTEVYCINPYFRTGLYGISAVKKSENHLQGNKAQVLGVIFYFPMSDYLIAA